MRLSDDKEIQARGRVIVALSTSQGKVKLLRDV